MGLVDYEDDPIEDKSQPNGNHARPLMLYSQSERDEWHRFKDDIAKRLWDDYCINFNRQ